ncbi:MAG: universal stress protein [Candidatus Acidiferrales bacterium]
MKALETHTRIDLKNVLFLTDFSPAATAALPYATELTKRFGAKLYALHVRPPVVYPMPEPTNWALIEEAEKAEAETERQDLRKLFSGMQVEALIEEGDLSSAIATAVKKNKIDLIVLGTRGRSGVEEFFMGSVAEQIFRQASCAVLTVGPFTSGEPPRDGEFTQILYATDFSPESVAAAPYAISLAQEFQAHLTLLHVVGDSKPGDLVHPTELVESSTRLLRKLVPPEADLWCEPRFVVERGAAAQKILEAARHKEADLIILGVRRPHGVPGAATHLPIATAHKVVSHAPCPVLTVRG